jgi:ribosomal protein L7/L12
MSDDVRRSLGEAEIVRRLRLLEAKMDLVLKTLNIEFVEDTSGYLGQVNALVAQGKLIDAIKVYRAATGASLSEAQAFVQGLPRPPK